MLLTNRSLFSATYFATKPADCFLSSVWTRSSMITIHRSDVPAYLRKSNLYQALDVDSSDAFMVPEACFASTDEVSSHDNCIHLLHTLRYWGSYELSDSLIAYLYHDLVTVERIEKLAEFEKEFPVVALLPGLKAADVKARETTVIQSGSLQVLQFLIDSTGHILSDDCCITAAALTTATCLQFLHERGEALTAEVCSAAASASSLSCLQYAYTHGCPWDADTCTFAAQNGSMQCLQYAHERGCPWDENTCTFAALNRHISCLQYAHENGCPWDEDTAAYAASGGSLECLQYVHSHGCSWDGTTCSAAAAEGHLACLEYAHVQGCAWDAQTCLAAAKAGHLSCLQYAHERGCPWVAADISRAAYEHGHEECYEYATGRGCPPYMPLERSSGAGEGGQGRAYSCMYTVM